MQKNVGRFLTVHATMLTLKMRGNKVTAEKPGVYITDRTAVTMQIDDTRRWFSGGNKNGAVRGTGGVRSWHADARIEFAGRKQTLKAT